MSASNRDERGSPTTVAPVFDVPASLEHPSGLRVWFVEPVGVITQIARPLRADMDAARFLTDEMDPALRALREDPTHRMIFVHDWRLLEGYSTDARKHLTNWGLGLRRDIEALVVVLGDGTSPMARMGINVAASALRLAGIDMSIEEGVGPVVKRLGLRPHPRAR